MIILLLKPMISFIWPIIALYKRIGDFIRTKKEMRGVEFVRVRYDNDGSYKYVNSNSDELSILNFFLRNDCSDSGIVWFKEAVMDETWPGGFGKLTTIEQEDGYIYMSNLYPDEDEEYHIEIKMTVEQFIQAIDSWQAIIALKEKPKEVIIKRKDDQFTFETHD